MSKTKLKINQNGYSALLLIVGVVVLVFLLVVSTVPFSNQLMSSFFPKNTSQAASGCQFLSVQKNQNINNFATDLYTWYDSDCKIRSAAMASNMVQDPFGHWGGVLSRYTYDLGGNIRTIVSNNGDHPGFGEVVSHFGNGAYVSNWDRGVSFKTAFQGAHHAIHEYKFRLNLEGPVDATVQWFFASGRDHPIYAITYDSRPAGQNVAEGDSRSPYGDLEFDGAIGSNMDGVGWGDHFKFRTLTSPVTEQTGWNYNIPNTVPYVVEWINNNDAEQGLVQTQTWQQQDAGGYWLYGQWGTNHPNGPMPESWNWPYQLNQYELPFTTASKRMAWGTNYGAVGQTQYSALGDTKTLSGYPFLSYSVYLVLDKHSKNPVNTQVTEIENIQRTSLTASTGVVVTSGPGGVGRTDSVIYQPVGYNQIFGTWEVRADNTNKAVFTVNPSNTALKNPIFVVRNYTLAVVPQSILINGVLKQANVDYFPSVDLVSQALWITLNDNISTLTTISIGMDPSSTPAASASSEVSIAPSPTPLASVTPGDIDGNGRVNIFDYNLLLTDFGVTFGIGLRSDINKNGRVDIFDYNILLTNFGK